MPFKLAFRHLFKSPGFAIAAIATLALCLGANLTIYAVVDAILLRGLPFPEADRLATAFNSYPGAGVDRAGASIANYFDRRSSIKAFSSVAVWNEDKVIVGESGAPTRADIARVSPEFFSTLGVPLALGHGFTDANLTYQTDSVAVLTDEFWRNHFNADPAILGRTFLNNGLAVTVVGVLPKSFHYLSSRAQFFRPASHELDQRKPDARHNNGWTMIARLAPGVSLADAQAQMNAFNAQQLKDDPYASVVAGAGYHTVVSGLREDHVHAVKPMLLLLQAGGLLLLAIGCVNLVNLLLIRASGRAKELSVRQALGASPLHVVRDVLAETTLLAFLGGLLGLLVGSVGIRMLGALGTDHLPLGAAIRFDARVAGVSLLCALLVGVALAVPVIWLNLRATLAQGLHSEGRSGTASRAAQRLRHAFIVAQVALAFVLLAGSGLLGASLRRVLQSSPGFTPENVLTGQISLPWKNYKDDAARLAFVDRLLPAIRSLPGVTNAAITTQLPFSGEYNDSVITVEGYQQKAGESLRAHLQAATSGSYNSIMGIPVVQGRAIEDADSHREQRVCVVDQAFAERYWPGASPLGRRIDRNVPFDEKKSLTIVGVVGDIKVSELGEKAGHGCVYFPYSAGSSGSFYLVVRTPMAPAAIAPMIQKAVLRLDSELPTNDLRAMRTRIDDSLVARRSPAILALVFSGVALLLASIGTYGVLAYAVNQRRREIGVRMALGARAEQILAQFIRFGAKLLAVGIVLGALCAWGAGVAMRSVLFEVGAFDAGVFAATAALLASVVFFAIYLPSSSASRVNPIDALRDD